MRYYRFLQSPKVQEPSWLRSRIDCFSCMDEDGFSWFYIPLSSAEEAQMLISETNFFITFEEVDFEDNIDWNKQWSEHSPAFQDNQLNVDLSKYTSLNQVFRPLYLKAGSGFGDLSHPTTRLVLAMMAPHIPVNTVVDIGCGSGILTLASILLGAKSAYGIDIDKAAISHAQENACLNKLENHAVFLQPHEFKLLPSHDIIILMNMIRSEQQDAWLALPQLHALSGSCFTSGIIASEKKCYLKECFKRGWSLIEEQQQDIWLGFHWKI